MSRRTRTHKRSQPQRSPKQKSRKLAFRIHKRRTEIVALVLAFALLAGGSLANWQTKHAPSVPATTTSTSSTASLPQMSSRPTSNSIDDIPIEAFAPPSQSPPMPAGYNAASGMLPPGALPPGVVLPGLPHLMPQTSTSPSGMMAHGIMPHGVVSAPMMGMPVGMTAQGYGYDGIRQQFTGQERDTETGLDYFGARYYSSTQGRFISVDPENAGADPSNPQSWNGYSYALNNPVRYTDPDGREVVVCDNDGACQTISDAQADATLFNREWQRRNGHTARNNLVYDSNGQITGTYTRTRFDDLSDFANGFIFGDRNNFGMAQRAPTLQRGIGILYGASVVAGVTGGVGLYALGPGAAVTTLGLGGATATRFAIRRLRNLSGLTRAQGREALERAGFQNRGQTGGGYERWRHSDGSEVWIRPSGEVVRVPSGGAVREAGRSGRGWRVDPNGNVVRPHTYTPERLQ